MLNLFILLPTLKTRSTIFLFFFSSLVKNCLKRDFIVFTKFLRLFFFLFLLFIWKFDDVNNIKRVLMMLLFFFSSNLLRNTTIVLLLFYCTIFSLVIYLVRSHITPKYQRWGDIVDNRYVFNCCWQWFK